MDTEETKLAIECLLFVGNEPLPVSRLMDILEVDQETFDAALAALREDLEPRSLQVVEVAGGLRMMTQPRFHRYVERYFEPRPERISRAGLEVLALIAYRQPITRPEIDILRGVNSQGALESLLRKGLIKEVGRKDVPGRPLLYATTPAFLEVAGLSDLGHLPKAEAEGIPAHLLGIPMEDEGNRELPFAETTGDPLAEEDPGDEPTEDAEDESTPDAGSVDEESEHGA
jgi:segregation and condensation protein B